MLAEYVPAAHSCKDVVLVLHRYTCVTVLHDHLSVLEWRKVRSRMLNLSKSACQAALREAVCLLVPLSSPSLLIHG